MADTKILPKDWDDIRAAFATSIMINTSLSSLAQNLDGPDWPIKGKDETPATYIDYNHEEVLEMLALKGLEPSRFDQLVSILKDTLAFDAPFGEMVDQVAASAEKDNPFLKTLARLGVPESFPISLVTLGSDTKEFCALEHLTTIGEFAVFAQTMSQNVIVGGDFRELLNALAHVDEQGLHKFFPLRTGQKGVFLLESLAAVYRARSEQMRAALAHRLGCGNGAPLPPGAKLGERELAEAELALRADASAAVGWFASQLADMNREIAAGQPLDRILSVLNDPEMEPVVARLLAPHLSLPASARASKTEAPREKKRGFFARLFGW